MSALSQHVIQNDNDPVRGALRIVYLIDRQQSVNGYAVSGIAFFCCLSNGCFCDSLRGLALWYLV